MSALSIFELGDRVLIDVGGSAEERSGTVRFIGRTQFKDGDWLGIELDTPAGKNDGSVAGVRYFSCAPFHGLFVPPNKARLNLSGNEASQNGMLESSSAVFIQNPLFGDAQAEMIRDAPPKTPNAMERIENYQMDFSAVKNISDSFAGFEPKSPVLKTPIANIKTRQQTPNTAESLNELSRHQQDMANLRSHIEAIKEDLERSYNLGGSGSPTRGAVSSILSKLNNMMASYEHVAGQYEALLQQLVFARKANRLDSSTLRLEDELSSLNSEKARLAEELETVRANLYNEIQQGNELKLRINDLEHTLAQLSAEADAHEALKAENERLRFDSTRSRTELDIEVLMEEERRRRATEHEGQMRELKARHESELHQKKLQVADLQNEIEYLKQTEKVLEEELNSRRGRSGEETEFLTRENHRFQEEISHLRRRIEESKRVHEEALQSKHRNEEYFRAELEKLRTRQHSASSGTGEEARRFNHQTTALTQEVSELSARLSQQQAESDRLTWSLNSIKKDNEQMLQGLEEFKLQAAEKDARIQLLEKQNRELLEKAEKPNLKTIELESAKKTYEDEIKRLSVLLNEERSKSAAPLEQVSALKRRVALIEREKELLEEQLRTQRVTSRQTPTAQPSAADMATILQLLRRHVDEQVLSLDPLRMTMQDVVRARDMVEILIKMTDEVRTRILGHLGQVEDVIRFRGPASNQLPPAALEPLGFGSQSSAGFSSAPELRTASSSALSNVPSPAETVKVERVRPFEPRVSDEMPRRRLDFEPHRFASQPAPILADPRDDRRYLRPTSLLPTEDRFGRNAPSGPGRLNDFRSLVTDLKGRQPAPGGMAAAPQYSFGPVPKAQTAGNLSHSISATNQPAFDPPQLRTSSGMYGPRLVAKVQEPTRCNLCHEYGHDALGCPDYLSGVEPADDGFLDDLRASSLARGVKAR